MARRGSNGRYILSAGEIAQFTVCPESWKLQVLKKETAKQSSDRSSLGRTLHENWASTLDESAFLLKSSRVILFMVLIAVGIFLLTLAVRSTLGA